MNKLTFLLLLIALPLQADLASEVRSAPGWVGYTVPIVEGRHVVCSWDDSMSINHDYNLAASALVILFEVGEGDVQNVRLASPECPSTKSVRWIRNVDPRESVRFVSSLIERGDVSVAKKALTALALQRGTADDLIRFARDHKSAKVRGQALFWVSQQAGERAAAVLRSAVDNDPEAQVKEKAVFGIAQLPDDRSIPILIELMKTHASPSVRKKAAFWLGQKDDPRALAAFETILNH
jgi:HEAT repeat protein